MASTDPTTYSFRAECCVDSDDFIRQAILAGIPLSIRQVVPLFDWSAPDIKVEFATTASLEELRNIMRKVPDGHVMLQTLSPAVLAGNRLERDYDLE